MRLPGFGRLQQFLGNWKVRRIHRVHRMKYPEDYQRIDKILQHFRAAGGLKHDYQAYKLFSLWQLLMAERPQRILELGTGTTTAMFADYIRIYGGRLYSIDESLEWLENSRKLAGIDADDPHFTLRQVERRVVSKDGHPFEFGYNTEFDGGPFDLVLIDGPSMRIDGERYKQAVNPDVFELVADTPPRLILVDIRAATVKAMRQRIKDIYHYKRSDIIRGDVKPDYRYFSEFRIKA